MQPGAHSSRRLAVALSLVLLLAGCGGSADPIPPKAATALVRDMNRVDELVRDGRCDDAGKVLGRLDRRAKALPETTDTDVRATLGDGVGHLEDLAKRDCKQKPPPVKQQPTASPPVQTTPEPPPTPVEPTPPAVQQPEPAAPEQPKHPKSSGKAKHPKKPQQPKQPHKPTNPSGGGSTSPGGGATDPCAGAGSRC